MAKKTVHLTVSQIEHVLGAIDFAETYLEGTEESFGSATREEAVTKRVLNNAAEALREGLHR